MKRAFLLTSMIAMCFYLHPQKQFHNYTQRLYIKFEKNSKDIILSKTENTVKELLNEHFFQQISTEFNDTTLQRIAKNGDFVVVNEYKNKVSSNEKSNCVYILIKFNTANSDFTQFKNIGKLASKKLISELENRKFILVHAPESNDYFN